jgi:hypothetical protein
MSGRLGGAFRRPISAPCPSGRSRVEKRRRPAAGDVLIEGGAIAAIGTNILSEQRAGGWLL